VDFDVALPRRASIWLVTVNGAIEVSDLAGATHLRTVSGASTLSRMSGRITLEAVSGDVRVAGSTLEVEGSTASGDMIVEADSLGGLRLNAVSGDLLLRGVLLPGRPHRVDSVSGDLLLATPGGVTVAMRSLSGSVRSTVPVRDQQRNGERLVTVGDGAAELVFRTVSGNLRLEAPEPGPVTEARDADADTLATLRALERGEIDVDEAARRLEGVASV
jgi:DUF4097 and DUF4098 domain-containing protein YvlB